MRVTEIKSTLLKFPVVSPKVPYFSVNPMHVFADLKPSGANRSKLAGPDLLVVQVETDEGLTGLATGAYACAGVKFFLDTYLAPLVIGADPFDTESLWEKLFRASIRLGREGLSTCAMSMIDLALWDIKGKALGQPVYGLLGGKTKDRVRVYASRLYGPDLGALREEAQTYIAQGFTAMKQRLAYGPWDGVDGMRKNRKLVETVRRAIGDDVELMVDCCRAFDAVYAVKMARMLEDLDLAFLEEPVLPHDLDGYVQVRRAVRTPIAGGEHEFSRHAFRRWAEMGCADIWQPDAGRCGGITELQKIVHLAASHGIPVIPHAGQAYDYPMANLHLTMANANMPLAEYYPTLDPTSGSDYFHSRAVAGLPVARDGFVELPDKPGLGLDFDAKSMEEFEYRA